MTSVSVDRQMSSRRQTALLPDMALIWLVCLVGQYFFLLSSALRCLYSVSTTFWCVERSLVSVLSLTSSGVNNELSVSFFAVKRWNCSSAVVRLDKAGLARQCPCLRTLGYVTSKRSVRKRLNAAHLLRAIKRRRPLWPYTVQSHACERWKSNTCERWRSKKT